MKATANFKHEDIVCSFKGQITDLGFIISNFNVGKWPVHTFCYKHNGYKHIEAENNLRYKHISSMCSDWQNSLSIS